MARQADIPQIRHLEGRFNFLSSSLTADIQGQPVTGSAVLRQRNLVGADGTQYALSRYDLPGKTGDHITLVTAIPRRGRTETAIIASIDDSTRVGVQLDTLEHNAMELPTFPLSNELNVTRGTLQVTKARVQERRLDPMTEVTDMLLGLQLALRRQDRVGATAA